METENFIIQQDSNRLVDFAINYFESDLDGSKKEPIVYENTPSPLRYYRVSAMCGHVGYGKYIRRDFGVIAKSKKEAIAKVLKIGKVKKSRKDAIIHIRSIDRREYLELKEFIKHDLYKQCWNVDSLVRKGFFLDEVKDAPAPRVINDCYEKNRDYKRKKKNLSYCVDELDYTCFDEQ